MEISRTFGTRRAKQVANEFDEPALTATQIVEHTTARDQRAEDFGQLQQQQHEQQWN